MRNLRDELHDQTPSPTRDAAMSCAIEQQLSCCNGVGFHLDTSGAFTTAQLCACIATCPLCYGQTRRMQNGVMVNCRDLIPQRVVNLINAAEIPARYGMARLETFANFSGNGSEVVQSVNKWLQSFTPQDQKGLVITGPVGVGKTYLLAAIAKGLIKKGLAVRFVDFFQLLNDLKAAYAADQADANVLKPLINIDVLIIDELGKGRNSDWELSVLDQLVMGRYNQRKTIIASTNYPLQGGETPSSHLYQRPLDFGGESKAQFANDMFTPLETRVGKRIFSRLCEMTQFIELRGEDFRRRK